MATKRSPAPGNADKLIAHQSRLLKDERVLPRLSPAG
jgi:hypothetical protein